MYARQVAKNKSAGGSHGWHDSVVLKIDAHSYCSYCSCMPDSIYVSLVRVECLFADCISYRSCCLFNQPCKTTQENLKPFVKRKEEKKQSKNKPPSVGRIHMNLGKVEVL